MESFQVEDPGGLQPSLHWKRVCRPVLIWLWISPAVLYFLCSDRVRSAMLMSTSLEDASPWPLLGDGTAVDWWFAFKTNTAAFPRCSSQLSCLFGGTAMNESSEPRFSLQYILASSLRGTTSAMNLHSECLGNGEDPLAKTFAQIYSGKVPNFVIWNDQFYDDPVPNITPPCVKYCPKPWGHSKGVLAWDDAGTGFVLQVTTPDWPGSGSPLLPRKIQGNTLGCCKDDNVLVSQHFFALRLASVEETYAVLLALQRASVVTDPKNPQLMQLQGGPGELLEAAKLLGRQLSSREPLRRQLGKKVQLIAKPSSLQVPPWQLVSSLLQTPLRTATWWTRPAINSTSKGYVPGCWDEKLQAPAEVQVALSGQWKNTTFSLEGQPRPDGNHAKLGHSLGGDLAVMGDMNQQGALHPEDNHQEGTCDLSQNARGGLFFVVADATLHAGLVELLSGETAAYVSRGTTMTTTGSTNWSRTTTNAINLTLNDTKVISNKTNVTSHETTMNAVNATSNATGTCSKCSPGSAWNATSNATSAATVNSTKNTSSPNATPLNSTSTLTPSSSATCGGARVHWAKCRRSGCRYVKKADASLCEVESWGCYAEFGLADVCQTVTILHT